MEILLVRHGESEANATGRIQGWLDTPLTELGREQARRLRAWLAERGVRWDAAYTSPLARARDTAALLGAAEAVAEPALQEVGLGVLEGLTRAEIARRHPGFLSRPITELADFGEWGGERYDAVQERILGFLASVRARHPGGRVLVVAHGGVNFQLVKAAICLPVPRVCILTWGNCTATLLRFRDRRGAYVGEVVWHVPLEIGAGGGPDRSTGVFR